MKTLRKEREILLAKAMRGSGKYHESVHTWYLQPKVHHGDFKAPLAASFASRLRPTL